MAALFPCLLPAIWAYTLSEVPFLYGLFEGFPILAIASECDRTDRETGGATFVGGTTVGPAKFWTGRAAGPAGRTCSARVEGGLGVTEREEGMGVRAGPGVGETERLCDLYVVFVLADDAPDVLRCWSPTGSAY